MKSLIAGVAVFCVAFSSVAFAASSYDSSSYTGKTVVKHKKVAHKAEPNGDDQLGFQFGPSIGSSNFSVGQGTTPSTDTRTRPMFGAFYEHRFIPFLSARTELNYVQRGFSTTNGTGNNAVTADLAANYLELPLMAKGQYQIAAFTPYVLTGPFVGMLIGKGASITQGGQSTDQSLDNQVNTFNFGWNFGAGTSYDITRTLKADLGLRYSMAFTNAESTAQTNSGDSIKLDAFQILAGLSFAI